MASGTRLFYLLIFLFCFSQIITRIQSSQNLKHTSSPFKRQDNEEETLFADVLCEAVWDHPDKCSFVQEYCADAGLINYFEFYFCSLRSAPALAMIIMIVWMIFLFALVGVAASDFFCPNLNTIAKQLRLSESMTGATFLAFGNASPDIFSTFSAMSAGSGTLAIGEVVGAALLITSVVVGSMAIIKPFKVNKGSFLRDTTFFTACILFTLYMVLSKKITFAHSVVLVVAYVAYVVIVVVGHHRDRVAQAKGNEPEGVTINIVEQDSRNVAQKLDQGPSLFTPDCRESSTSHLILPPRTHSRSSSLNRIPALVISHNLAVESVLDHASRASTDGSTDIDLTVHHSHHSTNPSEHHTTFPEDRVEPDTRNPRTSVLIPFLFPTLQDWQDKTFMGKVMAVASIPVVLVLQLTLPVVDLDAKESEVYSSEDESVESSPTRSANGANGWNRTGTIIQLVVAPVFLAAVVTSAIGGGYIYITGALAFGIVLSALVGYFSTDTKPPRAHEALAFVGFLVAMAWIFLVANEVVGVLQAFGMILKVSDAILGLTVFAMGNSLGDLVANITIARMGFPRMAFSACFGGPLLNMLLGVGISGIYVTLSTSDHIALEVSPTLIVSLVGVLLTMMASLVVVPRSGYELTRWWGWFLLSIYLICMVVNIVLEVKLPKPELP